MLFNRSRRVVMKENAAAVSELATQLASDKKFRKRLLAASGHGVRAKHRAWRQIGTISLAARLASDRQLRRELTQMIRDLQAAWQRVERKRSHRLRNGLLLVGSAVGAAAVAAPASRRRLVRQIGIARPRTIQASIEVDVPVSTAYNQWTQFEDFPQFMDGVVEVRQLDDTRLHWVAEIGGRRAEWDAKILEQHPDRQVSWVSEDGRKTRGTVSFEPRGGSATLITLSMSYLTQGLGETLGSAAGIDERSVRGDLERFKQLVEASGHESGAWRGDISGGTETTAAPEARRGR
jgi:uncharacterized membrane protein